MNPALAPEEELLVLCARIDLEAVDADRLDLLLRESLNWSQIERSAAALGGGPLLFKHLASGTRAALVPRATISRLQQGYQRQTIRNLRFFGHIDRIVAELMEAGLPVILLKGALLARSIYPDAALRPMCDIDLLCRRDDTERVRDRLLALGYHQTREAGKSPVHEGIGVEYRNHLPLFRNAQGIQVEVHFQIFCGFSNAEANLEDLVRAARPYRWNGRTVLGLAPEDQLAHLVLHLHNHLESSGSSALYWWCDIHELIRSTAATFDWDRFLARVDSLGLRSASGDVLSLLREYWRTPLPDRIRLLPPRPSPGTARGGASLPIRLSRLLQGKTGTPEMLLQYRIRLIKLLSESKGKRAVVSYLFRTLWPSREFILEHYRLDNQLLAYPYAFRFAAALSFQWLRTALACASRIKPG